MEKRPEKKPKNLATILVETPSGPFFKVIFFNKFGLESLGSQKILYFALMRPDGDILDTWTCIVSNAYLKEVTQSWLDYLGKVGELPAENVNFGWRNQASKFESAYFSNVIQIARAGDHGEIRFFSYSTGFAADKRRESKESTDKILAQPLGLLTSDLDLHIAIIMKLCEAQ